MIHLSLVSCFSESVKTKQNEAKQSKAKQSEKIDWRADFLCQAKFTGDIQTLSFKLSLGWFSPKYY